MRIAPCSAAATPSWPHTWLGRGGVFTILKLTPLDFAAAGFRQCIDEDDDSQYLVRRHVLATPIDEGRFVDPPAPFGSRHHEGFDGLAAVRVARADDAGFENGGVLIHQGLALPRPNLEPRGVDHSLQAICHEEVAVFIHPADIAGA